MRERRPGVAVRGLARAALMLLVLAACGTTAPTAPPREVEIPGGQPISLDVATVDVVDATGGALSEGVEDAAGLSRPPPVATVAAWAEQRLRPLGTEGMLRVTVREATLVRALLPTRQGLRGLVTVDQAERISGRLVVEVEGRRGGFTGRAVAMSEHSMTLPEDATEAERERVATLVTERMIFDIDSQMTEAMRQHLAGLVLL